MFGLQPVEIIFTLVLALLLFGPKKLPEIARGLGNAIREFRESTSQVTEEFRKAAEPEPAPATAPRSATIVTAPSVPAEPITPAPAADEAVATAPSVVETPTASAPTLPEETSESPPKP